MSQYLSYWYEDRNVQFFNSSRNNLDSIYKDHIEKISKRVAKNREEEEKFGLDEMKDIYEKMSEPKNLQATIEGAGGENLSPTEKAIWDLSKVSRENLMGVVYSKSQTIADVADNYCKEIDNMLQDFLADPLQATIYAAIVEAAKENKSMFSQSFSRGRRKKIDQIIDEWFKTHDKDLINVDSLKAQYNSLSDYIIRMESRLQELRKKIGELGDAPDFSDKDKNTIKNMIKAANSLKYNIQGRSGELASALGLKVAMNIGAEYFIEATGQTLDGKQVKIDDKLMQDSKTGKITGRVSKPDCVVEFKQNELSVSYGVTIKNVYFKQIKNEASKVGVTTTGSIKLVEKSNLFTLLTEDIGYTGDSLVDIYEVLSGHAGKSKGLRYHLGREEKASNDDSLLNKQFNDLRQILRAEALYTSLTGFAENNSERLGSFFMVVNGKFFPVTDVFSKIADRYTEKGIDNLGTTFTIHDKKWTRKNFTKENVFKNDNGDKDNTKERQLRSEKAKQGVESILQTTPYSFSIDKKVIWEILSSI